MIDLTPSESTAPIVLDKFGDELCTPVGIPEHDAQPNDFSDPTMWEEVDRIVSEHTRESTFPSLCVDLPTYPIDDCSTVNYGFFPLINDVNVTLRKGNKKQLARNKPIVPVSPPNVIINLDQRFDLCSKDSPRL